jgi:hypothetical protein
MKRMFGHGRYANVTATIALIVALGGTSYAAITLPSNSVGSKQLKKRAVTNSKLRANAVTSAKVKNGTLRARDFKTGELPVGPPGATSILKRTKPSEFVAGGELGAVVVPCNPGERAITGGIASGATQPPLEDSFTLENSEPTTTPTLIGDVPVGWYVSARNTFTSPTKFLAYVLCVQP